MARPTRETRLGPRDGEERLYRKRKTNTDAYHIDAELIPPGVSYEWKRESTYGQEQPAYMMGLQENHWKPVPSDRLPHMMPDGYKGPIRRDGLILMERPAYLTEEAVLEAKEEAEKPIRAQRQRMGQDSGVLEKRRASINVSYEEIPE